MSWNWFGFKDRVKEHIDGISKNVDKVVPIAEKAVEQTGKVSESVASVATSVANVAVADASAIVALNKEACADHSSFLARNVRPFIALASFAYLVLAGFNYVPQADWASIIVLGYMGMRTVDKLGQVLGIGGALKNIVRKT